jgi:putative membrane protein
MDLLIRWLVSAVAILVASYILPGVALDGLFPAFVLVVVLGLINAVLRPILLLLTLPVNILTLGLFTLVINGLLVLLAAKIVPGFYVRGFWWAVLFSVVLSLVNGFLARASRKAV